MVDPNAFSPKTEDPDGEFSFGVLQFILQNYPGPRVPDKQHGNKNLDDARRHISRFRRSSGGDGVVRIWIRRDTYWLQALAALNLHLA